MIIMKNYICAIALFLTINTFCASASKPYADTYVVIVAIGDYKHANKGSGDLTYPENDADKFYQFLVSEKSKIPQKNILLLKNEQASKASIIRGLSKVFAKAKANDRVIFYYSGHGEAGNLIPYDAKPKGINDRINYDDIKAIFRKCEANTKLCFIDACFANSIKTKSKSKTKSLNGQLTNADIIIMVSSQSFQTSIEYGALKQGVFSYFLLKGMEGKADRNNDKKVSIVELHSYVYKNVKVYTKSKQLPHTFGQFDRNMTIANLN